MFTTICESCGQEFAPRNKYNPSKTCSKECRYRLTAAANREAQGSTVESTCANPDCGREIAYQASKPKKYCSRECYNAMRAESLRIERTCPECGKESTNYSRQDQVYCSTVCRNRAVAKGREVNYPECKLCGVSTGSYNRAYCDEHRPASGPKPKPRRVAVCRECNIEFSRPGSYPGKMMFCSLKCSNRQNSRYRTQHFEFGEVHLSSGYELRFLACLLRNNIEWSPWPDDDPFLYDDGGAQREYRPDFIVDDLVVEVKGLEGENAPQRRARAQWDRPETLVLVDRYLLGDLEHIFGRETFLETLRTRGIVILRKAAA